MKSADPVGDVPRDQVEVRVVHGSFALAVLPRARTGHIDFRAVGGLVIRSAEADVEDIGIGPEDVAGAVRVVCVRVHDRETLEAEFLPQVDDAESHVVEAAEAAEKFSPRMMPARADEGEGVGDLAASQSSRRRSRRLPPSARRWSKAVPLPRPPEGRECEPSAATARNTGSGSYNRTLSLLRISSRAPGKSASRVPTVR